MNDTWPSEERIKSKIGARAMDMTFTSSLRERIVLVNSEIINRTSKHVVT